MLVSPLVFQYKPVTADDPGPFFEIVILTPESDPKRAIWADIISTELAKIGINVSFIYEKNWTELRERSWGYPGPYPIPTFEEGGFDMIFLSVANYDITRDYDLFLGNNTVPAGENFYQYQNSSFDQAYENYFFSYTPADRAFWAQTIYSIIYDDLPAIPIVYPQWVYGFNESLSGWHPYNWHFGYEPMHNWHLPGKTELHYATPYSSGNGYLHKAVGFFEKQWLHQIYNGLIERNSSAGLSYSPWLADSISTTDGLTYHIVIKDDAIWADGTPVTADDVIFNFELLVTPDAVHSCDYDEYIQHWDNSSLVKINDKELNITFKYTYVNNEQYLATDLLPKHIWGGIAPLDFGQAAWDWLRYDPSKIFGTGPYILHEYNQTSEDMHLKKNMNCSVWSDIDPYFEDIYFDYYNFHYNRSDALTALSTGQVDIAEYNYQFTLEELNLPGINYTFVDYGAPIQAAINMKHPYLGTGESCPIPGYISARYVRKAISHMIPREYIINETMGGIGRSRIYDVPALGFDFNFTDEIHEYSEEAALYYMAKAGFNVTGPPTLPPFTTNETAISVHISLPYSVVISLVFIGCGCMVLANKRRRT